MKKYIIILSVLLSLIACQSGEKKEKEAHQHEEEEAVFTGTVHLSKKQMAVLNLQIDTLPKRNLSSVIKITGELVVPPSDKAEVTPVVGGNIKKIMVFQGDKVRKGQVLAVLSHPDYINLQEEYAQQSQRLSYLKAEYERQKQLFENQAGAERTFQKAKSDYLVAKSKVQALAARLKLLHLSPEKVKNGQISSDIYLLAPISGYVTKINAKIGAYANPQDRIFEITDNSHIHPDFKIYEKDVNLVKKGQIIHFNLDDNSGKEYTAKVFAIGKVLEPGTRSVLIHANLTQPVAGLIPGMTITGHLHKNQAYQTTVPHDAIVKKGTKYYIFVLEPDDAPDEDEASFKMIEVVPGEKDENYTAVEIVDSLPKNAKVVLNKAYYLLSDMEKAETGDHDH